MKTQIRSDSEVFNQWADKVQKILTQVPLISANGHMPLEYGDDEWQSTMKRLQQLPMRFADVPIYPINETIANKLIEDQLEGANDKPDY